MSRRHWILLVTALGGAGVAAGTTGCRKSAHAPPPPGSAAALPVPTPIAERPGLPEDPVAGKASEEQWREHLAEEEHERRMAFDAQRLEAHRAVTALFTAARSRYDSATSAAAVAGARADVARRVADIRARVTRLDPHANSSHLLNDYEALATLLTADYADARLAALQGDATRLEGVRSRFDGHRKAIADWLEEVEHEEKEGAERGGEEREREEKRERR